MIDYLEDENGDLRIENGDLVRGDATEKHFKDLILSQKGDWKQYPLTGVGMQDYIDDDEPGQAYAEINKQLENDGAVITLLEIFENGTINLNGYYDS